MVDNKHISAWPDQQLESHVCTDEIITDKRRAPAPRSLLRKKWLFDLKRPKKELLQQLTSM